MLVHARRRAAADEGVALMEVVISAAVLVLVVMGVLAAMDSVTSTAGANKARTVAATLAERDQERLRGMRTLDVDEMPLEPYVVPVAGVSYTVTSQAEWVQDASGEAVSCGTTSSQGSYMRITSTVTSPRAGGAVKPVVLSSIVAPQVGATSQGSLSVMVRDAAGNPVQGLNVTVVPAARTEVTSAAGCAVFGQLDAGNHTVNLNLGGWVDRNGSQAASQTASVTAGNLTTVEFAYDRAASINVEVKDKPATALPDPALTVLAAHTSLANGFRTFTASNQGAMVPPFPAATGSTFALTGLFPFPEGYTIFSGGCLGNDPSRHLPDYFAGHPGRVVLGAGQIGGTITVYEPPTNIFVTRGSQSRSGVEVFAYPTDPGCEGVRIPMGSTDAAGRLSYHGLPYGSFTICATRNDRHRSGDLTVDDEDGPHQQLTLPVPTNGSSGPCPVPAT
jgi:hypothetical protein